MLSSRSLLHAALVVVTALVATPVSSETSEWSRAHNSAVRLVGGGTVAPGTLRAGLELRLDPGWKTYWRVPGESGVPPRFDWSGSKNVAEVSVLWPAPRRFEDEAGISIGYQDDVIFPLHVRLADPDAAAILALGVEYAICKTICIPAKGEAKLALDPRAGAPDAANLVLAAEATVPLPQPIGANGPMAIRTVNLQTSDNRRLLVATSAPDDSFLVVEGPEDWYLPLPESTGAGGFALVLKGLPKGVKPAGTTLRLTLVAPSGAIESAYTLPQ